MNNTVKGRVFILKGVMTVNIEIDYATMLAEGNQGAIYMFSGAQTIEQMVKLHMDNLGLEIAELLKAKPLVAYSLEGKLIQPAPQAIEEPVSEEVVAETYPEDEEAEAFEVDMDDQVEVPEDVEVVEAEIAPSESMPVEDIESEVDLEEKLNDDIDHVSMDLGIPQVIKMNAEFAEALGAKKGQVATYQGFPVEQEGMDVPYLIVYKAYKGSGIKVFAPEA